MKKVLIPLMLMIFLTGCDFGNSPFLASCRKKAQNIYTETIGAPRFDDEKMLEYTYIIDGIEYTDRLITSEEKGAFDFFKLISLLGVEHETDETKIKLNYMGVDIDMPFPDGDVFALYHKGEELVLGVNPYMKNGKIYVSEEQIQNIKTEKKLPLDVIVDEETKTVNVLSPFFSDNAGEPIKYFDMTEFKGEKTLLILDGETMKIKVGDVEYEKTVEKGYIDGKIEVSTDAKSDIIIYLWDGEKVKNIPLKLG